MNERICMELNKIDISNIYIYIGDAVRWDIFSELSSISGIKCKTIASSIHSPTSFASIVSGLHPPQHRVKEFKDQLSASVPTLFDLNGYDTGFANSINALFNTNPKTNSIIHQTLNIEDINNSSLNQVSEPFIFLERGPGGHAPYGNNFEGNAHEYFVRCGAANSDLFRKDYKESIMKDLSVFRHRLKQLKEKNAYENTLIIYTSDHGELLGEGGFVGHNGPIHEKLVYVPTVFHHPELPSSVATNNIFRHIDLVPTLIGLLDSNRDHGKQLPGRNILEQPLPSRGFSYYDKCFKSLASDRINFRLCYNSMWNRNGGHVFSQSSISNRIGVLLGLMTFSPRAAFIRANFLRATQFLIQNHLKFGAPDFTTEQARDKINNVEKLTQNTSEEVEVNKERLHDLGYL